MKTTHSINNSRHRSGIRRRPSAHEHIRRLERLAQRHYDAGRYQRAEPLLRRALQRAERSQDPNTIAVAAILNRLAMLYKYMGRYAEAGPLYRRALAIITRRCGPEHPDVASIYHNLGGSRARAWPLRAGRAIRATRARHSRAGPWLRAP